MKPDPAMSTRSRPSETSPGPGCVSARPPGLARMCLAWMVLASAFGLGACGEQPDAATTESEDLILHGGTVWTGGPEAAEASAVVVRGGRIAFVGGDEEALAWRSDATRVVDLDGAFLLPGFSDNHVHFASAARFLEFNIMKAATQDDLEGAVRDVISRLEPGEWIVGGLWGAYDQWAEDSAGDMEREPFSPDLRALDDLSADHPMFLRRFDDGAFAVNAAALRAAGLDPDDPHLEGATFVREGERGGEGRLTGVVIGDGVAEVFEALIPPASRERRLAQTRNALEVVAAAGVTNVSDMSDDLQLELYRELHAAGELTTRIHFRFPLDRWPELKARGIEVGHGDDWIRLGALKGHIDGIMGNSSARFYEPYDHDPTNRGRWRRLMVDRDGAFAEGRFLQYMLDADAARQQLSIHAIGDEANGLLLDYLEELRARNGVRDRRFRLVHAQVVAEVDMPRMGELGVIAEVQPFHLSDDMRWMEERIGERVRGAYAFRSLQQSGAILSFGSDWPGTAAAEYPIDPRLGLYAATTRQTLSGEPEGGWFPDEKITMEEALRAYTWGSTYANFEEASKGTVEVGKLADLTVLQRDPRAEDPTRILDNQVLYTIVDGRIVYRAE